MENEIDGEFSCVIPSEHRCSQPGEGSSRGASAYRAAARTENVSGKIHFSLVSNGML